MATLDELLVEVRANVQATRELAKFVRSTSPGQGLTSPEQRQMAQTGQFVPYAVKSFALDAARTDEEVVVDGDFIHAWTDGDYAGIGVRYNIRSNDLVYFQRRNPIYGFKFWTLYLTHTAQVGKTLDLLIGREASAYASSYTFAMTLASLIPLEKANQHGVAEVADTDILAAALSPTNTPCLFRIGVMLETAGVFSVMLTKAATTKQIKANAGVALEAGSGYLFDALIHSGDTVNFQTSVSGNVTLRVQEIVAGAQ